MMMNEFAYALSLGSNLGDRVGYLHRAARALEKVSHKICFSRIYETAPMYVTDQPVFLNMAATLVCCDVPQDFLPKLKNLEQELGRVAEIRHGPRVVDIDIILCGDMIIKDDGLTVPHQAFRERDFVLRPLAEIAPDWIDPQTGASVANLASRVRSDTVYLYQIDS